MRLLFSPTSPYSAKVRMTAHALKLDVVAERVDTNADPDILISNNPLGKIPVLLTDDGQAVYDSRAIMQFLDRLSGGRVFPGDNAAKTDAQVLEATADGITDCLLAIVYERRFHPVEKVHEPWIDRQKTKAARGLSHLTTLNLNVSNGLNGGHFAAAALLGYLELRFPGEFDLSNASIQSFVTSFTTAFPEYTAMKPQ